MKRRSVIVGLGGAAIGARGLGHVAGGLIDTEGEGIEPDAITIVDKDVRTYPYSEDDIDAEAWVLLRNDGTQAYRIKASLAIYGENTGQIGRKKVTDPKTIHPDESAEFRQDWTSGSSIERHTERVEVVEIVYFESEWSEAPLFGGEEERIQP